MPQIPMGITEGLPLYLSDEDEDEDRPTGIEVPAEADTEADRRRLECMARWAEGFKAAPDDGMLLNARGSKREVRVATSVDLDNLSGRTAQSRTAP